MKLSIISNKYNPAFVANAILTTNPNIQIIVTTFFLSQPDLSIIGAATASTNYTDEVKPANTKHTKNKTANIFPHTPIMLNTLGKTINAKPIPPDTTSSRGTP